MAEQPWQIRLEHLALTQDEKNKAENLIPLRFTTVEERVLFLRGSAEKATSRVRSLLNSQPGESSFQPCICMAKWPHPKKSWTSSRDNQASPMQTLLDHSSLCLISSFLASRRSCLHPCLYAVLSHLNLMSIVILSVDGQRESKQGSQEGK